MAEYNVPYADVGVHLKTLVANQVDTVTFTGRDLSEVEILSDGSADIFVRLGGADPVVGSGSCWRVPAAMGSTILSVDTSRDTIVKLISSGTPTYSVSRTR